MTPWTAIAVDPVPPDERWTLHFVALDGHEDWGYSDDWHDLHALYQHLGSRYRVELAPIDDQLIDLPPPDAGETPHSWFAFSNPSLCH
jgi:hypothetical protein